MDYTFGPVVVDSGAVTFRLYALSAKKPEVLLRDGKALKMERGEDGF